MQVYKVYFKIIKSNIIQLMIYVFVFLFLAVILSSTYSDPIKTDFTSAKVNIAFINEDEDSILLNNLKDYLESHVNFIALPHNEKSLQDALFFRQIEYIVRIPKGFTKSFLKSEKVSVNITKVPESTSGIYMDTLINKYLNTARIYIESENDMTEKELIENMNTDLSESAEIVMLNSAVENDTYEKCAYYYNYLSYSLFAILILGVSAVMMVFHNKDLKKRNNCSPLKLKCMNFQMILGNFSFTMVTWILMIASSFILYGSFMFTSKGLLFIMNSFVFTLPALSISYLIGNLIKSKNAMSAVSNVVSLGTCFISGVFVPQAHLGDTVLKLASFTPTYWYVKTNNAIADSIILNTDTLMPLFYNMLIMVGFAVAVLVVTLVIIKQKRGLA